MTDLQLYTKISSLPADLKKKVEDFIDSLKPKVTATEVKKPKRVLGLGKGMAIMKDNFDEPLEDFKDYM